MNRMEKNMKKNLDFLFQLGQIGATKSSKRFFRPDRLRFFLCPKHRHDTAICREEKAQYNSSNANKPRRLRAVVDSRHLLTAGILNSKEAVMSAQRTAFVSVSSFCFYQKNTLRIFLHAALASGVMFCRVCLSAAVRYVNWIPACAGMTEVCHINVFAR